MIGDVDTRHIDVQQHGREPLMYWAMWGLITVEAIVFASLISTYFYLQAVATDWPPEGLELPSLLLPTINTAILLACMPLVRVSDRAVRKNRRRRLVISQSAATALAIVFIVIKGVEYSELEFRWDSHAYGSSFYALTGFHLLHMIALVLKTLVTIVLSRRGYFTPRRDVGVQVNGLYWYFVLVVWIPLYLVVYISPRVLP